MAAWRGMVAAAAPGGFKPFSQSFYIDLSENPDDPPQPIHLGIRGGRKVVLRWLNGLRAIGVNHVILNFKYGARDAADVLEEFGQEIMPQLEDDHDAGEGEHRAARRSARQEAVHG